MIRFKVLIEKFGKKGEKTGWTYITIPARQANKIKPDTKVSFRIHGKLDDYPIKGLAILPMGQGDYILPLNASIRKQIKKKAGDTLTVEVGLDDKTPTLSADLVACLKEEPAAYTHFKSLPKSHQNYFSKWIESAKTVQTKSRRIAMALNALSRRKGFNEMVREAKQS